MTDTPGTERAAAQPLPVDDLARLAIATDGGPDELDIPDENPGPRRDTGPRPEDGDQDAEQDPAVTP